MSEQKTHAEIIARMRSDAEKDEYTPDGILGQTLHSLADSLEAAQRREIDVLKRRINELDAEIAAKDEVIKRLNDAIAEEQRRKTANTKISLAVGNIAKLREALSKFCAYSAVVLNTGMFNRVHLEALLNMAKAALAAPARNCDVGTAEEQLARQDVWCRKYGIDGDNTVNCAHPDMGCHLCTLRWAQIPYKEGGNDGK